MVDPNEFSAASIERLRDRLRQELNRDGTAESTRDALREADALLATLVGSDPRPASFHDGFIEYTLEDEPYEPFGRELDVRIYYDWQDYDVLDEPRPVWGADIADVEVLAVRHFDREGNVDRWATHLEKVAWNLVEQQREYLTERCTQDGRRNRAGRDPSDSVGDESGAANQGGTGARRMAPSRRERGESDDRRRWG